MFIVTSRNKGGSDMIIWKFRSFVNAWLEYKNLMKLKYPDVHISQVIK